MIFWDTFLLLFPTSCHTVLGRLSKFKFIIVTLNSAKAVFSSNVKTILGETFAGSPVYARTKEPESGLEN